MSDNKGGSKKKQGHNRQMTDPLSHEMSNQNEDDQQQQYSEEEAIQKILELGNQCLMNLGINEPIDDVQVFTCDQFYIQFFENAFPDFNFSNLEEAQSEEEMADNIQALIELLSEQILNYDLSHIRGEEIVQGNPDHIINLLQLAKEISVLMQSGARPSNNNDSGDNQEDVDARELLQDMMLEEGQQENEFYEGEEEPEIEQESSSRRKRRGGIAKSYDDRDDSINLEQQYDNDVDYAIEQIASGGKHSEKEDREIEQIIRKNRNQKIEDENDDQVDDTPIHPDLIAAAQEMGLALNPEQMRELQQFIEQQNMLQQEQEDQGEDFEDDQQQVMIQGDDDEDDMQYDEEQQEVAKLVQSDKKRGESDQNLLVDLNELDENEKQMLLAYLQDEYDKNPDQFQFPKEKLQEIMENGDFEQLREHLQMLNNGQIKAQEMIVEDDQNDVEGGQVEIEDRNDEVLLYNQQQNDQKRPKKAKKVSSQKKTANRKMKQAPEQVVDNLDPTVLDNIMQQYQEKSKKVVKKQVRPGTAKQKSQPSNSYGKFIQQNERGRQRPVTAKSKSKKVQSEENPESLPVFNQEFLNQLSEEQLQELLQQQQALMQQQQIQISQQVKPKRSKSAKRNQTSSNERSRENKKSAKEIYSNPPVNIVTTASRVRRPSLNKMRKQRTKRRKGSQPGQGGRSLMMNNFFPALNQQDENMTQEEFNAYQAMQAKMVNQHQAELVINEALPEEEEGGESQDITNNRKQASRDNQPAEAADIGQVQEYSEPQQIGLSEEQLMELLQNADQLTAEQQEQLQLILKDRWNQELKSQKKNQYNNIYNILTENVAKAKQRLSNLAQESSPNKGKFKGSDQETVSRILKQKQEYETLLKQHMHERQSKAKLKEYEQARVEKQIQREQKLAKIREKKFEEELINQQKSLMYKRNAQQVRLCQKVYKLASQLEKNKLLEEKKEFRQVQEEKLQQKKKMVDTIENFYKDKINMLKERVETERYERRIAQQAQSEALNRMKKEVTSKKKGELDKYLLLLKQEDQKYDFQSSNVAKLEEEILKLYKK